MFQKKLCFLVLGNNQLEYEKNNYILLNVTDLLTTYRQSEVWSSIATMQRKLLILSSYKRSHSLDEL